MTPLAVRALCVVFFVSGAAALVFETLWFRQAGFAFGSSAWASVLVLSSFMAGLALGNLLSAAFGTRIRRPVRFYALLEGVVGLSGLALVWLLGEIGGWLAPLMRPLLEHAWLVNAVRFGIAFVLLLVPATAMGATLPVLVMAFRLRDPSFGSVLGRLYGFNTIGAVVGALAGEMLLLGWFGVLGTGVAAALLYFSAASVALALSRGARTDAAAPAPAGFARIPARAWNLVAAAFVSGGILLAFEVVWFRILLLFTHPSSLAFAVMLAVVLAGIGSGGFAAGAWLRRKPGAFRHATLVAFLAGAVGVVSYVAFPSVVAPFGAAVIFAVGDIVWLSACLMLPASFVSGLLFTMTGTALNQSVAPDIQAAGLVTLFNTLGAALGSVIAGFVLLPWLGIEGSYFLLTALYVIAALLLLAAVDAPSPARLAWAASPGAALLAVSLAAASVSEGRDYYQLAARRFDAPPLGEIAEVRETRTGTLMYLNMHPPGEPPYQRLVTGAFGMASNQIMARRYMKLYVYWPVALRPDPKSALLIGFGTGSSAKALTDTRSFERIDIADISRDVIEMGRLAFPNPEAYPISDPRVKVYIEDGRYLLQATEQRYDLITSEPPPPKFAGVESLYSKEYFQLVREHLTDRGINTHWLPVHFLEVEDTRAIIRGYCEAFPDCSLWTAAGIQWMLVGSREAGAKAPRDGFEAQWRDPVVGPELRALGIERPAQLGAMFMADAEQLRGWVADTPPLEDNFPRRLGERYAGGKDYATYAQWMDTGATRRRFEESSFIREAWPESIREETLAYFDYQRVINDFVATFGFPLHRTMPELDTILDHSELRTLPRWLLGVGDNPNQVIEAEGAYGSLQRGNRALADRDFERAAAYFARAQDEGGGALPVYLRLYAVCRGGRQDEARALAAEMRRLGLEREAPEAFLYLEKKCGLGADPATAAQ